MSHGTTKGFLPQFLSSPNTLIESIYIYVHDSFIFSISMSFFPLSYTTTSVTIIATSLCGKPKKKTNSF